MSERQSKTTSSCYCLKTRRASAALTKFYDNKLAPCGVTVRQYSLLLNISQAENCSVKELADMTELDRSTLARSLKPLYQQALVIDTKELGTRNSQLELTRAGKQTVECANQLWAEAQEVVEEKFGEVGLQKLEMVMARLEAL